MPILYAEVIDEHGHRGKVVGMADCRKQGCDGHTIAVNWGGRKVTRPCNKEHLEKVLGTEGTWRIKPKPQKRKRKAA